MSEPALETILEELDCASAIGEIRLSEWEWDFVHDLQDTAAQGNDAIISADQDQKAREIHAEKFGG